MVPQMVSEVLYPEFSMQLLRQVTIYLRSSSAFPAIGRFVIENETAMDTTMTMITGAGSAAAYGAMISKRARAATGARADFNIRKLFGRFMVCW